MKKFLVIAGMLLLNLTTACSTNLSSPEPTITPSLTVTPIPSTTPTPEPTIEPTEAPSIVRPESVEDSIFKYTQEQLDAIHSGVFQEGEDVLAGWLDYWLTGKPETGEELNFKTMPLTYIYLFDADNLDNMIVALESPDYPNTAIFPPIDFEKSKGLDVYFMESLPYEKEGHSIPPHLMPTFLTIDADQKSVDDLKMQARFLGTTLTNKGGKPVRIDKEGKVVAKIGVKQESLEARWVRAELCTDYSNPENYTTVTIDEIRSGQILYDEEVQAEPFPESVEFPRLEKDIGAEHATVWGYDKNGSPTTKYFKEEFFYYVKDQTFQFGGLESKMFIAVYKYLQSDRSNAFITRPLVVKKDITAKELASLVKSYYGANQIELLEAYPSAKSFTPGSLNKYEEINGAPGFLDKGGLVDKATDNYINTGFFPKEISLLLIPGGAFTEKQ